MTFFGVFKHKLNFTLLFHKLIALYCYLVFTLISRNSLLSEKFTFNLLSNKMWLTFMLLFDVFETRIQFNCFPVQFSPVSTSVQFGLIRIKIIAMTALSTWKMIQWNSNYDFEIPNNQTFKRQMTELVKKLTLYFTLS